MSPYSLHRVRGNELRWHVAMNEAGLEDRSGLGAAGQHLSAEFGTRLPMAAWLCWEAQKAQSAPKVTESL